MEQYQHVLSPLKIGNIEIKNRIETPPMLSCLATADGHVTREFVEFYKAFARGGAGIVTLGDTAVDVEYGRGHYAQLHVADDSAITGLSLLVEEIQRYGAKISIELDHSGRLVSQKMLKGKNPIGPSSAISAREELVARMEGREPVPVQEMDQDMIDQVIQHFVNACNRCLFAGFEMVMIHGGHGQLINQFLSPVSNFRKDKYGGSLENRARFAIELLTAIRKKVGNKLVIEYRISADELIPEGMHEDETIEFIKMIEDKIDIVHASLGGVGDRKYTPYMSQPTYFPHQFNVHRAEKIKKAVKIPVTCVGSIITLEMADKIVADGKADIVAMGRAQIADHDLVNKSLRGEASDVRPCLRCGTCGSRASDFFPVRCAVNPVAGRETMYDEIKPARKVKKVVIIGGGPAGMEAAQIASSRGHKVILLEKDKQLGGTLLAAAAPDFKPDIKRFMEWQIKKIKDSAVEIKLSADVNVNSVKALSPDAIIVATGAEPRIPEIPGINNDNVVTANDFELGEVKTGEKVVVAGAGLTGCETGLHIAREGKQVTIIDMLKESEIALDTNLPNRITIMDLLEKSGARLMTEVTLVEISNDGVVVADKDSKKITIPADTVVLSLGVKSRLEMIKEMKKVTPEVYAVGDCRKPRNLMAAIHDGFNTAVEI